MLHLADLHINTSRHAVAEYTVLFECINRTKRDITIICGDIFDSGVQSPADISVFGRLITTCTTPLIIIPGNHDIRQRNPQESYIEAILAGYPHTDIPAPAHMPEYTPAVGSMYTLPNGVVYFAHRPGPFVVGPAVFYAVSQTRPDPAVWPCCTDATRTIALVHAPTISAALISRFDIVMAGDIHVRTFVARNAAYAGSPIQVNISESNIGKGGILWDIATCTGTAVDFNTEYGYAQYDNTTIRAAYTLPAKPYEIRIYSDDADIHAKLDAIGVPTCVDGRSVRNVVRTAETIDIARATEQQCAQRQEVLQQRSVTRHPVQFKRLEFSNIRNYNINNHVEFSTLAGLIGLVGDNAAGKTSLIYALCLALYGKPPRGTIRQALRIGNAVLSVEFVAGQTYTVRRSYRDYKLDGYSLLCDGVLVPTDSAADMAKRVQAIVGPMNHLLATHVSIDILDDFVVRSQLEQAEIILAMYGYADWTEWRSAVAAERRLLKKQIGALCAAIVSDKTDVLETQIAGAVATQRVQDMIDVQAYRQHKINRYNHTNTASTKPSRTLTAIKASLLSPDSIDIRILRQKLDRNRQKCKNSLHQEAELADKKQALRVADAHALLLSELPRAQFVRFIRECQPVLDDLLDHLPMSAKLVHEDDRLSIAVCTNGIYTAVESASGFEYTVVSLAVRAAMLQTFGHTFMFVDDYYSRVDANMCGPYLTLLHKITARVGTVIVVSHTPAIIAGMPFSIAVAGGHVRADSIPPTQTQTCAETEPRPVSQQTPPTTTTQDSRGNVVFNDTAAYRPVPGGYLCLRCTKPTIVKRTNGPHNKMHR